jgi:hypothetical protein
MSLSDLTKVLNSAASRTFPLGVFSLQLSSRRVFARLDDLDPVSADRVASPSLVVPAGSAHNGQSTMVTGKP